MCPRTSRFVALRGCHARAGQTEFQWQEANREAHVILLERNIRTRLNPSCGGAEPTLTQPSRSIDGRSARVPITTIGTYYCTLLYLVVDPFAIELHRHIRGSIHVLNLRHLAL